MHEVLVRLLTETVLQYSTFYYKIEETNLSLFRRISANAVAKFGNRSFFKDMNFSEPFQTVTLGLLSCLVVRIINHMIIYLSYFPNSSSFFMALKSSMVVHCCQLKFESSLRLFIWNFKLKSRMKSIFNIGIYYKNSIDLILNCIMNLISGN